MNICPKCGSPSISKPRYSNSAGGSGFPTSEALVYECLNCGYEQAEMTKEQKMFVKISGNELSTLGREVTTATAACLKKIHKIKD